MAQNGYKRFLNRRKWDTNLTTSYSAPVTPDTYLSGTHSFNFKALLEYDAPIKIYLDPNGSTSLTASFETNYVYTGAPQTIQFNVSGLSSGYYNFRVVIGASAFNADYVGGSFEPNTEYTGQGPYFEPVLDLSSCPTTGTTQLNSPTFSLNALLTEINIAWVQINSASGYYLEKSLTGVTWTQLASVDANTFVYSDTTFVPNTTYYYRLKALGNGSNYLDSSFTQSSIVPSSKKLTSPNLTIGSVNSNSVQLLWADVNNESYYALYRSFTFSSQYEVTATFSANTTEWIDSNLVSNKVYFYKLQAKGDGITYIDSDENSVSVKTI